MQANFGRGDRPGHDITPTPEVEGHGFRARSISDEPEIEGHIMRVRGLDGNEFDIPEERIISVTMPDGEEVEGHGVKFKLDQDPDVEGHAYRIKFRDDSGQEQEVEGHAMRWSDLRLKHRVEPLRNVLARLRSMPTN